jgi:hypothetical protein
MDKGLLSCRADSKHDKNVLVGWDEMKGVWSRLCNAGSISVYNNKVDDFLLCMNMVRKNKTRRM